MLTATSFSELGKPLGIGEDMVTVLADLGVDARAPSGKKAKKAAAKAKLEEQQRAKKKHGASKRRDTHRQATSPGDFKRQRLAAPAATTESTASDDAVEEPSVVEHSTVETVPSAVYDDDFYLVSDAGQAEKQATASSPQETHSN